MFLTLLIPVLVAGFIICNKNPYHFYKLHRHEGQYLYLKSAQLGLNSFLIVLFVCLILDKSLPSQYVFPGGAILPLDILALLERLLATVFTDLDNVNLNSLAWVLLLSITTIIYAYLISWLTGQYAVAKFGNKERANLLLMYSAVNDSPLDKLFFDSFIESEPLLITMDSRKVYVGYVASMGEPNETEGMDQEITIVPMISGYRDKDTLEVTFTTEYDSIDYDLKLVLRQELITTATWFKIEVYKKLNDNSDHNSPQNHD